MNSSNWIAVAGSISKVNDNVDTQDREHYNYTYSYAFIFYRGFERETHVASDEWFHFFPMRKNRNKMRNLFSEFVFAFFQDKSEK